MMRRIISEVRGLSVTIKLYDAGDLEISKISFNSDEYRFTLLTNKGYRSKYYILDDISFELMIFHAIEWAKEQINLDRRS